MKHWKKVLCMGLLSIAVSANLCLAVDAVPAAQAAAKEQAPITTFYEGGDFSMLHYIERKGGKFYRKDGTQANALDIAKDHGVNIARVRIYNDPGPGRGDGTWYCPPNYVIERDALRIAGEARERGMAIELTLHYSDYWTNGERQNVPHEWSDQLKGLTGEAAIAKLEELTYAYTKSVMEDFKEDDLTPEFISLGNETQGGMLYPYAKLDTPEGWQNYARLVNAGARAVREVSPTTRIILHIADGGHIDKGDAFFGNCQKYGIDYDIMGASYYPFFHKVKTDKVAEYCDYLHKKYGKQTIIMETGYAWNRTRSDGWPGQLVNNGPYSDMSKQGQKAFMQDLFAALKAVPDHGCIGDIYWDPVMIKAPDAGWAQFESNHTTDVNVVDNTTWFDFEGKELPVLDAYGK